jgi:hypothetical protein
MKRTINLTYYSWTPRCGEGNDQLHGVRPLVSMWNASEQIIVMRDEDHISLYCEITATNVQANSCPVCKKR